MEIDWNWYFSPLSSHWILSILMVPEIPIAGIAAHFYEKKNPFEKINAIICASIFYLNPSFESDKFCQRDLK